MPFSWLPWRAASASRPRSHHSSPFREARTGDELDRRIHRDALSAAFPAFVVAMVGWDLLSQVHWPTPPTQLRWPLMPFLYGLWVWILKFHYSASGEVS